MSNVLLFTSKHNLDFQKNYDEFVEFTKNHLTIFADYEFDGKKGWDCDKWSWVTPRGKKLTFVFGISHSHSSYTHFRPPFSDFAKAYVRYEQSLNHKDSVVWASSLVWIYKAMEEYCKQNEKLSIDVMDLNNTIINRVEDLIKASSLSPGSKRNIGLSLESVLKFIKEKRFKLNFQDWKNPFPRQADSSIKLDKENREAEQDKCPSDYQMLQVASAFHNAESLRQKYFSSLCVIMMCQPSRAVELKGLTIHSLQKSAKGRWYLSWYPAKGGDPIRKWIPKLMEDVVQQAFNRLIEISAPSRKSAKFAFENPDVFMVDEHCITSEPLPQNLPLTYNQFATAMGLKTVKDNLNCEATWGNSGNSKWLNEMVSRLNGVKDWRKDLLKGNTVLPNNKVVYKLSHKPIGINIRFPSYNDLRLFIDGKYKTKEFPNYGRMKLWDCVTLVRENEFHKDFAVKPFSWIPVEHGLISDAIGSERPSGDATIASIFDELGITDEDGSRLKLDTHQFRHWLNTKLKLAGEDDWLIAKWSGRADIEQNKAYDGRTQDQKSRLTKRIGHVVESAGVMTVAHANLLLEPYTSSAPPPPIILHDLELSVSLKSLGVQRDGVGQFTGLGYCVHNYAESPCVKNGDCEVCSDHVCIKGLPNTLEELKNLEKLYEEQLEAAMRAAEDKTYGTDRWITSLGFRLSVIKTIIITLEDPKNLDGTMVRIPNELDTSPVKRSLNIDKQTVIPTFDLTALALTDMED